MPADPTDLQALLRSRIIDVPDFPQPGVFFKDLTPLLADPAALAGFVQAVVERWREHEVGKVAGIEARGFLLGTPIALDLGVGFVPIRKRGKLPRATYEATYDLEYGTASIEVHRDAFAPGERVLLVDDVLATGGTAASAVALVRRTGAVPIGLSLLLELTFLHGRERLTGAEPDLDLHVLLTD